MRGTTTSLVVVGVGAAVAGVGATMLKGRLRDGVVGFGLAHITLGLADLLRPSVRE
jgi:hypothetical protein